MARAIGLMDPANAVKSAGAFKEGFVRIDSACYRVHKGKPGEGEAPVPATKLVWLCTRLTDDGTEPVVNENDEPVTEELFFSFGGKCLPFVHPGKADSADDEEPEDQGTNEGAEGNTIFLVAVDWKPNEKSGVIVLGQSMLKAGIASEYLNRCWAPDWTGCVFEMKHKEGEKGKDGRVFNYKIVSKVITGPGGGKKSKAASASANGGGDAEAALAPILRQLSEELDNQTITRKAFVNRVRGALDTSKTDAKLLVPVLSLLKDDVWLNKHAETFDYTLDNKTNSITFGSVPF
jgi:hypothetical protein